MLGYFYIGGACLDDTIASQTRPIALFELELQTHIAVNMTTVCDIRVCYSVRFKCTGDASVSLVTDGTRLVGQETEIALACSVCPQQHCYFALDFGEIDQRQSK